MGGGRGTQVGARLGPTIDRVLEAELRTCARATSLAPTMLSSYLSDGRWQRDGRCLQAQTARGPRLHHKGVRGVWIYATGRVRPRATAWAPHGTVRHGTAWDRMGPHAPMIPRLPPGHGLRSRRCCATSASGLLPPSPHSAPTRAPKLGPAFPWGRAARATSRPSPPRPVRAWLAAHILSRQFGVVDVQVWQQLRTRKERAGRRAAFWELILLFAVALHGGESVWALVHQSNAATAAGIYMCVAYARVPWRCGRDACVCRSREWPGVPKHTTDALVA